MGYGDSLMAIGDAWALHQRDPQRRKVAIGDGRQVEVAHPELRRGLDFLATQNDVDGATPWVISFRGFRPYHDHEAMRALFRKRHPLRSRLAGIPEPRKLIRALGRFVYRMDYRPTPAPIVFDASERAIVNEWSARRFVLIEPHVKDDASPSKRWPLERYAEVARGLSRHVEVLQIGAPDSPALEGLVRAPTRSFRDALVYLTAAQLYIGPEGGLHHAAAATGTRAVVLFGGYTPPEVTGYDFHARLTGGAGYACGEHFRFCEHCRAAMARITADEVLVHALRQIET